MQVQPGASIPTGKELHHITVRYVLAYKYQVRVLTILLCLVSCVSVTHQHNRKGTTSLKSNPHQGTIPIHTVNIL